MCMADADTTMLQMHGSWQLTKKTSKSLTVIATILINLRLAVADKITRNAKDES